MIIFTWRLTFVKGLLKQMGRLRCVPRSYPPELSHSSSSRAASAAVVMHLALSSIAVRHSAPAHCMAHSSPSKKPATSTKALLPRHSTLELQRALPEYRKSSTNLGAHNECADTTSTALRTTCQSKSGRLHRFTDSSKHSP